MALTDDNNMVMPVQPMYGGYGNNGGFGFGGDWAWILLLLVLGGGWGGFGGFGMGAGMLGMGMADGFGLYPWLNNSQNINDGFRDAQLHDSVTSVRDGISSLSTQLCNCCGDMQLGLANGVNSINQNLCNGFNGVTNSILVLRLLFLSSLTATSLLHSTGALLSRPQMHRALTAYRLSLHRMAIIRQLRLLISSIP